MTGNNSGSVTLSGSLAAMNTVLAALKYTPTSTFSGADTLKLSDKDTTDNLTGAVQTAITVNPLPAVKASTSVSLNENGSLTFSGVNAISLVDTAGAGNNAETLTLAVLHGSLKLGNNGTDNHGQRNGIGQRQRPAVRVEDGAANACLHAETGYSGGCVQSDNPRRATDQAKGAAALTAIKVNPLPAVKAPISVSVNENGSLTFSRSQCDRPWSILRVPATMPRRWLTGGVAWQPQAWHQQRD